jgi:hypothetical protein
MRLISEYQHEIASLAGALLSLSFVEKLTIVSAIGTVSAGVASAFFFAPPIAEFLHWSERGVAALGFVMGVAGFGIAAAIHQSAAAMKSWLPETLRRAVDKRADGGD